MLLSDVLGVEVFFLAPTVSDNGAGVLFCALLSPSTPCFDGIPLTLETLDEFPENPIFTPFSSSVDPVS